MFIVLRFLGKEFEKDRCYLFSKRLLKLSVKLSGPRLLFVGIFLITFSISLLVIVLFIFSNSSWFSLESMHVFFQEFIHFPQVVIFYWITVVYGSLYDPLYIWVVSCDFFFFISNFTESLLFFSWVWLKIYQFCLHSQGTNFYFYWSLLLFSCFLFHLFLVWSLWVPFFCWLWVFFLLFL